MLKIDSLSSVLALEFGAAGNADVLDSLNRAFENKEKVSLLGTEGYVTTLEISQDMFNRRTVKLRLASTPNSF